MQREWGALSDGQRVAISDMLWERYKLSVHMFPPARETLASAVCVAAVLTPAGSALLTSNVLRLLGERLGSGDRVGVVMGLQVLTSLPNEERIVDCQHSVRDEVEAQLIASSHHVLPLLAGMLAGDGSASPFSVAAALSAPPPLAPEAASCIVAGLDCLKAWASLGIALPEMTARHPQLVRAAAMCLCVPANNVVAAASNFVDGVLASMRYPRPAADDDAVATLAAGERSNRLL